MSEVDAKEWVVELWCVYDLHIDLPTPPQWLQYTNSVDGISEAMKVGKFLHSLYPREAWRIRNIRTGDILPAAIL